jgi:hypothetical protein
MVTEGDDLMKSVDNAGAQPGTVSTAPQKARPVTSRGTTRLSQSEIESLRKTAISQTNEAKAMLRAEKS